jgi:putative MATE family efflux protein
MSHDASGRRDYTKGPIGKAIVALAIPMVLEMLMESVFAVVDIFFVGKLGADAVATVGLTESMMTIVYTLGMGLAVGAAAVTARRTGEGDPDGAAVASFQSILLGIAVSAVVGALGVYFAGDLLALMGAAPSVIDTGVNYTRVLLGGNVAVVLLFLVNAAFRGVGDAWIAMRSLWLANGVNVLLCPLLVFGLEGFAPAFGVTGAAIATTAARGIGAAYVLWKMVTGGGRLHVQRAHMTPSPRIMATIAKLSASGAFQMFIGTASWIALFRVMSTFGSVALAGYTIGIRLIVFALMPAFGLGNAAATMVGQSLGARDPERAEKAVWISSFYASLFLGVVGLGFFLAARPLVALFTPDPAVQAIAVDCLRILACGYPFYAYGMVATQAFNGAGDTWTPTWINLGVFWLLEIPLAMGLAMAFGWGLGPDGVFYAVTGAFTILAGVASFMFKRGGWKAKVV